MGPDEASPPDAEPAQDPILLEAFFEEAAESLEALERALLLLETGAVDAAAVNGVGSVRSTPWIGPGRTWIWSK